jgi:hypothetical protein
MVSRVIAIIGLFHCMMLSFCIAFDAAEIGEEDIPLAVDKILR